MGSAPVIGLRGWVAALAFTGALAWAAAPALADGTDPDYPGSVLHVTASGPLTPGSVLTITATGSNEQYSFQQGTPFTYGLDLFLVSADELTSPCATSENAEETISANNARYVRLLTFDELNEGQSGPFDISTPVTLNNGTGHLRICAYSVYGFLDDAAWATTEVTIAAAPGKPAVKTRPRVTRSGGRLLCSKGNWSNTPTSYQYRWVVLHKAGTAGRAASLAVSAKLHGHTVECSVTAKNATGSASATSRPFKVA